MPYAAWYGFIMSVLVLGISGYTVFLPGQDFPTAQFFFSYGMIFVCLIIGIGWKIVKRTRLLRAHEIDLTTGLAETEAYTDAFNDMVLKAGAKRGIGGRISDWLF